MRDFPYTKAVALLNLFPEDTFVAMVNGEFYTLKAPVMRGFLQSTDSITYFKRFA